MKALQRVSQVFDSALQIPFDDNSKIILMSDCHRGDGSWADDFSRNQNLYFEALTYYYNNGYTYIEIGDGDELWENSSFLDIKQAHSDAFWLLSKFHRKGRLYMIYGNHDMVKKDIEFSNGSFNCCVGERKEKTRASFENIKFHEGIVLTHKITGDKILLIHGHQVDCLNDQLWKLARFLVRYLWRPLNTLGVNDPTRAAKNFRKKDEIEKRLTEWVIRERHMLIAGHTHRPMFPETHQPAYFNDGSCVHPRCITGIEIDSGCITLVKWNVKTREDGTLFVNREILAGPGKLKDYFA